MLNKEEKKNLVKKYGKSEKDTGSVEVQVAILTKRISDLTAHLKANHGDATAKRSLMELVGKRRTLLAYLNKEIKAVLTNDFWNITLPRNLAVSAATPPAQSAFWAAQVLLNAHSLFINDFIAARLDQRKDAKHSALETILECILLQK